jgi:hypothetical protein
MKLDKCKLALMLRRYRELISVNRLTPEEEPLITAIRRAFRAAGDAAGGDAVVAAQWRVTRDARRKASGT